MRLIDLMCDWHRQHILDTRLWPEGYQAGNHNPGNNSCHDCGVVGAGQPAGRPGIFPGYDTMVMPAVHEAGHVVAVAHLGGTVEYVTLESSGREGSTAHWTGEASEELATSDAMVTWGLAAESATRRMLHLSGNATDANLIDSVSGGALDVSDLRGEGFSEETIRGCLVRADDLVADLWMPITRVAEELMRHGRLNGAEIAALAGVGCAA
ncbi:MAG TPA: hypothetical protein VI172_08120 [Candidatus Dormibacteraeota bacterium]|jgi:hypothetical protein